MTDAPTGGAAGGAGGDTTTTTPSGGDGTGGDAGRTFTQAELDKIVGQRVARERSQFADYDELKTKAGEFDRLAESQKSEVQKATDNQTGRTVCLKVQHFEKHAAANLRSAANMRPPEGEIASKVIHPHVVRTYEFGLTHKGEHFIVMEFVEGVSLQFVREAKSANLAEKLELLAQAAEGLAAVHAAGFIHHDIGPKNFLVNRRQTKVVRLERVG